MMKSISMPKKTQTWTTNLTPANLLSLLSVASAKTVITLKGSHDAVIKAELKEAGLISMDGLRSHIIGRNNAKQETNHVEAAKKVMGLMEQLTARQIIVRLKDNGRKKSTPRQLAQRFRTDQEINVIKSRSKRMKAFQKIAE